MYKHYIYIITAVSSGGNDKKGAINTWKSYIPGMQNPKLENAKGGYEWLKRILMLSVIGQR